MSGWSRFGVVAGRSVAAFTAVAVGAGPSWSLLTFDEAPGDRKDLPVYKLSEIKAKDGTDGPTWVTYKNGVYDISDFINAHPGGASKIVLAAGGSVEPFWNVYRQHFTTTAAIEQLAEMRVGTIEASEYAQQQEAAPKLDDAYANEPTRHPALIVHGATPMNAEPPGALMEEWITPNEVWYLRHHHPVPTVEAKNLGLSIKLSGNKVTSSMTLERLKSFSRAEVVSTMQCAGNRRGAMNDEGKTSGTSWLGGACSTARWAGAPLREVVADLLSCSPGSVLTTARRMGARHVAFEGADGMSASIPIEKALSEVGDVLIAYEMNGVPVPRDHGAPLRVIVPGFAGVRNVKWLSSITLQSEEAEGAWQRGMNYKTMPNTWRTSADIKSVDFSLLPSIYELPTQCVVTTPQPKTRLDADDDTLEVRGWALGGAGRAVVRVEVSSDEGKTWTLADMEEEGVDQPFGRAWAWTMWSVLVPRPEGASPAIFARAMDAAGNSMPETSRDIWNLRGLNNNSWYRVPLQTQKKSNKSN